MWEGFVNSLSLSWGSEAIKIGTLDEMLNRVMVAYREMDWGVNPPQPGSYTETDWAEDLPSIYKYGYLEEILSGGQGDDTEMINLRDSHLEKNRYASRGGQLSTTESRNEIAVTLEMKGYYAYLNKYYYSETTTSGKEDMALIAARILAQSPNSWCPRSQSIITVGFDAPVWQEDARGAWDVMKDSVAKSQGTTRLMYGMFEGLNFIMAPITSSPGKNQAVYTHVMGSSEYKLGNSIVHPAYVRPGRWVVSAEPGGREAFLIEQVTYNYPEESISVNYEARTIRTLVESRGLGGI